MRAARQQDFLRQVRNAAGARRLLDYRRRRQLATIFARYTDTDKGLRRKKDVFSLLKLVLFTGRKPVREVRFRVDLTDDPVYLTASKDKLAKTANEFLNAQASKKPRQTSKAIEDRPRDRAPPARRASATARPTCPASRSPGARARTRRSSARGGRSSRSTSRRCAPTGARYAGTEPRIYGIRDERGKLHRAYRLVVSKGPVGEYYGIQGTTWREPPILDDPSETRKVNGRKLELHYDGRRLRLVAWRTKRAVYWVSNTLTQSTQHAPDDRDRGVAAAPRPEVGAFAALARLDGFMSTHEREPIGVIGTGYVGLVTAAGFAELGVGGLLHRHRRGQDPGPQGGPRSRSGSRA